MVENNTVIDFKDRNVYKHFNEFIKTFLLNKNSYVLNGTSEYKINEINKAYETFCKMSLSKDGKDLKFDSVSKNEIYEKF